MRIRYLLGALALLASGGIAHAQQGVVGIPPFTGCATWSSTNILTGTGSACSGGSGTVTTVSVVSANGLAGTVANPTTTPAITLSTTITGILSGNGAAISGTVPGTGVLTALGVNVGTAGSFIVNGGAVPLTLGTITLSGFTNTDVWFTDGTAIGQSPGLQFTKSTGVLKIGNDVGTNSFTLTAGASNLATFSGGVATPYLALGGATHVNALDVTGSGVFSGSITTGNGSLAVPAISFGSATGFYEFATTNIAVGLNGALAAVFATGVGATKGIGISNGGVLGFEAAATGILDAIISRPAPATLQYGALDSATPVAQTLKFQDVVAGTTNTAGVNATIQAPAGTGTGAGGSLIFQVAPAGSTGTAKNAFATALTLASTKDATFAGYIVPNPAGTPTCGSGCAAVAGNDQKFVATTGTAQTSVTVNFGHTWAATPVCTIGTNSTASVVDIASTSTAAITFGASVALTGATINVVCF